MTVLLDQVVNFGKGTLAGTLNSSATSFTLASGNGAKFPSFGGSLPSYNVIIWNWTDFKDPMDDPNHEVIRINGRSSDTFSPVVRGQESTSAVGHETPDKEYKVALVLTAKMISDIDAKVKGLHPTLVLAYAASNLTVPTGSTATKVANDTESMDKSNEYDPTALFRFTAKIAAPLRFQASVLTNMSGVDATKRWILHVRKNGANWTRNIRRIVAAEDVIQVDRIDHAVAVNDYYEVFVEHDFGTNQTIASTFDMTYFQVHSVYDGD